MAEELIRILVDHLSDILFTPTNLTSTFLEKEEITDDKHIVGNTIVDVCLKHSEIAEKKSNILDKLDLNNREYILATIHRPENVDNVQKLAKILHALNSLEHPVILPAHPRIKRRLAEFGYRFPPNITAIDPVDYNDMVKLLKHTIFVATDSGGVQEEAVTLRVPCLTLRETTERWETINIGSNFLVGSDPLLIGYHAKMIVETNVRKKIERIRNPYGDGKTSEKIVDILKKL
jgi:UDP-N-acetylglucosamine 2-epimerase